MIIPCPSCKQKNRVSAEHLTDRTRCGACKVDLPAPAAPIDADTALFQELTKSARVPVLVDFWADWCGPCKMAAPEVAKTAQDMAGRALVVKVDTEAHPDVAASYNVRSIPNFAVFKGGNLVHQQAGVASSAQMTHWLKSAGA